MSDSMDLLVLGDQAVDTYLFLKDVLARGKSNTIFSSFLARVSAALREEVAQLPRLDRECIPDFSTVQELADRYHDQCILNPAIESALLCISQLGHYIGYVIYLLLTKSPCVANFSTIRYTEEEVSSGVDPSRTYIVGLCTGSLAAAAIASSPSPGTLVPLAVETVRIAFRTGLQVGTAARRVHQTVDSPESWAVLVSETTEVDARHAINDFHDKKVRKLIFPTAQSSDNQNQYIGNTSSKPSLHQCCKYQRHYHQRAAVDPTATVRGVK